MSRREEWERAGQWVRTVREEFEAADEHGPLIRRLPLKYLHKAAELRVMCTDCGSRGAGFLIAAIVPAGRPLLAVRERDGQFVQSVFIDGAFWGDIAYCRRRQWALHADDLAEAIAADSRVLRVSHDMKR